MIELAADRFAEIRTRARNRCEFCHVPNWSVGGRDRDGNFHPLWLGEASARPVLSKPGARAWCGKDGPQHLLPVGRIVCEVVSYFFCEAPDAEDLVYACQRCRRFHPHWPVVVRFPDRHEALALLGSTIPEEDAA